MVNDGEIVAMSTDGPKVTYIKPDYSKIYREIPRFCETSRTRSEIEKIVKRIPAYEEAREELYATCFIMKLEGSGGLKWVDNWLTTDAVKKCWERKKIF